MYEFGPYLMNSAPAKLAVGAPDCVRRQLPPGRHCIRVWSVAVIAFIDLVVVLVQQFGLNVFILNCTRRKPPQSIIFISNLGLNHSKHM